MAYTLHLCATPCAYKIKLLLLLFQWKKEFIIFKTFVATPLGDLEKKAVLIKKKNKTLFIDSKK